MTTASRRGAGLLVAAFAAGLLAGVALERFRPSGAPTGPRIMIRAPEVLDQLGLTPVQRHAADSVLEQSSPRSEAAMRELVPRLAAIADSVDAELDRILTAAQRRKFDSLAHRPVFVLKHKDSLGTTHVDTIRRRSGR